MKNLEELSKNLVDSFMKQHNLQENPSIVFAEDLENSKLDLGSTAHYEPESMKITIYMTGRHVKDTLRSLAHELVHHMQNCRGEFSAGNNLTEEGYAQNNEHLREMEREAYECGNMFFRDWEDGLKSGNYQLYETIYKGSKFKGEDVMSTKDWKNQELNGLLMEKWGYVSTKKKELNEEVDSYMDLKADYKTLQKELPEDETLEEEEELEEAHPSDVEARVKGLENLEKESLKKEVIDIINELLSEESEV
tara:strand:- start:70455 stop:71204 length:750 start_codon:yes stop_codon:yes gene_type:complete